MAEPLPQTESGWKSRRAQILIVPAAVALIAFAAGFVPMWLAAGGAKARCAQLDRELRFVQIENLLATAALDARRGNYEPARQGLSQFYTRLNEQLQMQASGLTSAQKTAVEPLIAQRDQFITLLARSDPASAERLSDLHVAYRKALASPVSSAK